jgi:hypothetical protein
MGSVVSHECGSKNNMPPYVCIPGMPNEFAAGRIAPSRADGLRPEAAVQ